MPPHLAPQPRPIFHTRPRILATPTLAACIRFELPYADARLRETIRAIVARCTRCGYRLFKHTSARHLTTIICVSPHQYIATIEACDTVTAYMEDAALSASMPDLSLNGFDDKVFSRMENTDMWHPYELLLSHGPRDPDPRLQAIFKALTHEVLLKEHVKLTQAVRQITPDSTKLDYALVLRAADAISNFCTFPPK
jgi:hypothetical protein